VSEWIRPANGHAVELMRERRLSTQIAHARGLGNSLTLTRRFLGIVSSAAIASTLAACGAPVREPAPHRAAPSAVSRTDPLLVRPAPGTTISRYDKAKNKGIDIGGREGDPIVAAADGRVVYVGDQLRGYGRMVIIKHNDTLLTAYAHNRAILVKENDVVVRNQKIAEMGHTDADRVKLHFEVRKNGIAVDPEPYLSGRLR
jgi:lipoprotein NlpD